MTTIMRRIRATWNSRPGFRHAKMQLAAAEVGDFSGESRTTLEAYGVSDSKKTRRVLPGTACWL